MLGARSAEAHSPGPNPPAGAELQGGSTRPCHPPAAGAHSRGIRTGAGLVDGAQLTLQLWFLPRHVQQSREGLPSELNSQGEWEKSSDMAQGSRAPLGDTTGLEISMKVPKKSRKCFTARCGHRNVFRDICPLFACWLECGCDCRVPCFLGTARQEKESLGWVPGEPCGCIISLACLRWALSTRRGIKDILFRSLNLIHLSENELLEWASWAWRGAKGIRG